MSKKSSDDSDKIDISKYIDSDEEDDGKNDVNNLTKIMLMCQKEKINIYSDSNKKKIKHYSRLIELCNKRKRHILKLYVVNISHYITKQGLKELPGIYTLESASDSMINKLKQLDKLINLIEKEYSPPKKQNILMLLGVKKKSDNLKEIDDLLEEYSD